MRKVPRGPTRGVGSNAVISCQQPAVSGQWNKDGSSSLLVVGCWLLDTEGAAGTVPEYHRKCFSNQQPVFNGQWDKEGSSSLLVVGCWLLDTEGAAGTVPEYHNGSYGRPYAYY